MTSIIPEELATFTSAQSESILYLTTLAPGEECEAVSMLNSKTIRPIDLIFTQEVLYPWLGPPLRSGLNILFKDCSSLGDMTKYAIKLRHVVKRALRRKQDVACAS